MTVRWHFSQTRVVARSHYHGSGVGTHLLHSTCAMSPSSAEGSCSRLLPYFPSPYAHSHQVTHFFFCSLSPWQQTKRRLYVSVILAARHSGSADTRCNPHLTVYKVLGHRTCQSIYLLLHIIGSIIEAHFERLMFCFSVPRDPSTTLGPSGRGSGN